MGTTRPGSDGIISWGQVLEPALCASLVNSIMTNGHIDTAMQLPGRSHIDTWAFDPRIVNVDVGRTMFDFIWDIFKTNNPLNLAIDGIDTIRMLRYSPNSAMSKHADWSPDLTSRRKLSLTVQLSDPTTYEGGNVVLDSVGSYTELYGASTFHVPRPQAMCTVWPSWMPHQVTPLIRGERLSLVAWASGPSFR